MSALSAARALNRIPLEKSVFRWAGFSSHIAPKQNCEACASRVKQILRHTGLTMAKVSALTSIRYGKKSPCFIPPTFLYTQKLGITPHICQIVGLSQITGYRFDHWTSVFGFNLELIFALQLTIHTERTVIVTPNEAFSSHLRSIQPNPARRYLFAKIGTRDAVVYPKLLPGSVVRADRLYASGVLVDQRADRVWLVEHSGGLTCCHVRRTDSEHVVLSPSRPPLSPWPLRLSREARILGLVDLEFRPQQTARSEPISGVRRPGFLPTVPPGSGCKTVSALLRSSRLRAGLTLRRAHEMTMHIARLLRNRDYGIALGLLSDYEAMNSLPRHVAKFFSLCVIYGIGPGELLEAAGIRVDDSSKASLYPNGDMLALGESA